MRLTTQCNPSRYCNSTTKCRAVKFRTSLGTCPRGHNISRLIKVAGGRSPALAFFRGIDDVVSRRMTYCSKALFPRHPMIERHRVAFWRDIVAVSSVVRGRSRRDETWSIDVQIE
jgi:hypothetical protein